MSDIRFSQKAGEGPRIEGGWPYYIIVTREFLEGADSRFVSREWRTVRFGVVNGGAEYRIMSRGPYPRSYHCSRLDGWP